MSRSLHRAIPGGRTIAVAGLVLGLVAIVLAGCSQERRTEPEIQPHPTEWSEPAASAFHGHYVAARTAESCESCHGGALEGTEAAPSCSDCHLGPSGHPYAYAFPASDDFHGDDVAAAGPMPCTTCHGEDYRGGWAERSCFACHAGGPSGHPDPDVWWRDETSLLFHGRVVLEEGDERCQSCHGDDFGGGTSGVACTLCHDYPF